MTAVTYNAGTAAVTAAPAKAKKNIFARMLDALIEARMREADRQIRMHLRYIPEDMLRNAGFKATYMDAEKLPFVK